MYLIFKDFVYNNQYTHFTLSNSRNILCYANLNQLVLLFTSTLVCSTGGHHNIDSG